MKFYLKENRPDIVENDRRSSVKILSPEKNPPERMISGNREQIFSIIEKNGKQWQEKQYTGPGELCGTVRWNRTEEEQSQTIFYLS